MKKKILAFCLASGIALSAGAQQKLSDKDLPAPVQTTFKSEFPKAGDADWKMKEGKYKVHFKVDGTKQIASFDQSGKLLSKGVEIKESELPPAISSSTKSLYADRKIGNAYKVEKDGSILYLVKLKGNPEKKILYSADGQEIKNKSDW